MVFGPAASQQADIKILCESLVLAGFPMGGTRHGCAVNKVNNRKPLARNSELNIQLGI